MHKPRILLLDGISLLPLGQTLYQTLLANGEEASYVDARQLPQKIAYGLRRGFRKRMQKRTPGLRHFYHPHASNHGTYETIKKINPNVVFVLGYFYKYIDPQWMKEIKQKLGFQLILLDTDSANTFVNAGESQHFFREELPLYDHLFSFSQVMVDYFKGLGLQQAQFFPFGASEVPLLNLPKTQDVFFASTPDMRRLLTLESIKDFNLSVYGERWSRFQHLMSPDLWKQVHPKALWGKDLSALLQSSKIALNINILCWHAIESGVNLRVFEILAARSFLLTEYSEELGELFCLGEEAESYKTIAELKDKIRFYLDNDSAREKIAQKGHEKFLRHFTWEKRMKALTDSVLTN